MKSLLRLAVSAASLGVAAYLLDWRSFLRILAVLSPATVSGAIAISMIQYAPVSYRWYLLVRSSRPERFIWHLQHFCTGTFLNTFTPANIGGDVYRFVMLRQGGRQYLVLLALVRERLAGLQSYLLGYLIFWLCYRLAEQQSSLILDAVAFANSAGLAVLWALPVVLRFLRRHHWLGNRSKIKAILDASWKASRFRSPREFASISLLSMAALFIWYLAIMFLAHIMEIKISLAGLGIVVVLAELIRLIPITIQGIGLREGAYAYAFTLVGAPGEEGFALAAVGYLALTVAILLVGLIGMALKEFAAAAKSRLPKAT